MRAIRFLPPPDDLAPEIDRVAGRPHPREMLSLVGQEAAEQGFLALYNAGRLHHALLLAGPEGIGKATFAYRAARFLLDEAERNAGALLGPVAADTLALPENARATLLVAGNAHPDLAVLRRRYDPKTKKFRSEISVEDTREALGLFAKTAAFGGWRILIVDAADDLNAASANALLKTLEEPPERALFLIIAHQPERLLPTIRSRCRRLGFAPLGEPELAAIVAGLTGTTPDGTALGRARGSVRRALRLADPSVAAFLAMIETALGALPERREAEIGRIMDAARTGAEGEQALADLIDQTETWLERALSATITSGDLAGAAEIGAFFAQLGEDWRRTEAFNLDRRAFVLKLFEDAAALVSGRPR